MLRERIFQTIGRWVISYPRTILGITFGLCIVSASLTLPSLRVTASHTGLAGPDNPHEKRFVEFLNQFGSPDMTFGIIEGGTPELRRKLIDQLERAFAPNAKPIERSCHNCVKDVIGHIDLAHAFDAFALYYLSEAQLISLRNLLSDERWGATSLASVAGLPHLFEQVAQNLERSLTDAHAVTTPPDPAMLKQFSAQTTAFLALIRKQLETGESTLNPTQLIASFKQHSSSETEESLSSHLSDTGIDEWGYFTARDTSFHLVVIRPNTLSDEPEVIVPFIDTLKTTSATLIKELSTTCAKNCGTAPLTVTFTGLPALIADETVILDNDLLLTSGVAMLGIFLLFGFGFRSLRQGLLGMIPILIATISSLVFVRIVFGQLNMVTAGAVPTILGLSDDFAVHLLARYNEFRHTKDHRSAAFDAIVQSGPGLLTGTITTAAAFFTLLLSEYRAFAEMGIVAGVGLFIALIATLLVLPAILVWPRLSFFHRGQTKAEQRNDRESTLVAWMLRHRIVVLVAGVTFSGVMFFYAQRISWSYSYLDLLPKQLDSIHGIKLLDEKTVFSGSVAALKAHSLDEMKHKTERLSELETVGHVESIATFLPENAEAKRAVIASFRDMLPREIATTKPFSLEGFRTATLKLSDTLEDLRYTLEQSGLPSDALVSPSIMELRSLRKTISTIPASQAEERLRSFEQQLLALRDRFVTMLRDNVDGKTPQANDLLSRLPSGLATRLYDPVRREFAIYIYPKHPIWDKTQMTAFATELRTVDHNVTGFPITHWEAGRAIEAGFRIASLPAFVLVIVFLIIDFRQVRFVLLALVPLVIGILWMWGGLGLLGMSYNFANIVAFPLIIGIGVSSGVHIIHRYRQEGCQNIPRVVASTGQAIFLSAATTMIGFGSLALAHHQGAASLGITLLMGVGTCLLASVVFLPILLSLKTFSREP